MAIGMAAIYTIGLAIYAIASALHHWYVTVPAVIVITVLVLHYQSKQRKPPANTSQARWSNRR